MDYFCPMIRSTVAIMTKNIAENMPSISVFLTFGRDNPCRILFGDETLRRYRFYIEESGDAYSESINKISNYFNTIAKQKF